MSAPKLRVVAADPSADQPAVGPGWSAWLRAHLDPGWRPGEWDPETLLFTGDLASNRTAAWPCCTPGCPTATRFHHRRCEGCRRARTTLGVGWEDFDAAPPTHPTRPLLPVGDCAVTGCESELHCAGLCFRHERAWRTAKPEPMEAFIARAVALTRGQDCLVPGCAHEHLTRRGLCRFHGQRLHRQHHTGPLSADELADWVAAEEPRVAVHQFSLARLPELARVELLYGLQQRDLAPPPLDPTQVRILLSRLAGAASLRGADPEAICESGGMQYNSATSALFRDLRRHLERAWAQHTGIDPFDGDVWQVALLDLQANASRPWPATQGVVDFGPLQPAWLREVVKDWARATRPYLQRLRETLRAAQAASGALSAAGRLDPTSLGAGDFTHIIDAISGQRRADGSLYSAQHRNLLLYQFCQVIEHGRAAGLMSTVPDPFRPARRHRVRQEPNEDELGKALPESVIAQLDARLDLLGPAGRSGSTAAADLQAMHQTIYQILRDTGRRPGEVVSLRIGCVEVIDGQHNLIYDNHKSARMRRRLPITSQTARLITTSAPPRPAGHPTGDVPVVVPQPAATSPPLPRAPHAVLRGQGVQGMDHPDRHHRRRTARTQRHPGPVRPGPGHALRAAPLLRPTPRRRRGARRRPQGTHGPRLGGNHDGVLPDRPQTQTAGHPLSRGPGHRRPGQPGSLHQHHRL